MNITSITEVNGKKLSKSQINLLSSLVNKFHLKANDQKAARQNPYTGKAHELEPLAVALYDFIINQYRAGFVGSVIPVTIWDRTRYLFLALWPDQYYDLID